MTERAVLYARAGSDDTRKDGRNLEGGATFERKRRVIKMMDVQGVLAVEDGEKAIHVRATLGGLRDRLISSDASLTS